MRFLAIVYQIVHFLALSLLFLNAFLSLQPSDRAFSNPISFRVHFPALVYHIVLFLALSLWVHLWALISLIVCFLALFSFPMSASSSPHFSYSVFFSPISFYLYAFILYSVLSSPIFFFFFWMRFWALISNNLKRIDHFLMWWICYLLFLFVLYKAYYLKSLTRLPVVSIVKRGQQL